MTESKLKALVAEAVSLDRVIADQTERLKEIKSSLVAEAQTRPDEHTPTEGGGTSWTVEGNDGCVARVTFPGAKLKASIDAEKPAGAKLMAMVGKFKDRVFKPVLKYVPADHFREEVADLFGPADARKIIKACTSESSPTVAFETKEGAR